MVEVCTPSLLAIASLFPAVPRTAFRKDRLSTLGRRGFFLSLRGAFALATIRAALAFAVVLALSCLAIIYPYLFRTTLPWLGIAQPA